MVYRVVVTALEVIEPRLSVVVVPAVAQRGDRCKTRGQSGDTCQEINTALIKPSKIQIPSKINKPMTTAIMVVSAHLGRMQK